MANNENSMESLAKGNENPEKVVSDNHGQGVLSDGKGNENPEKVVSDNHGQGVLLDRKALESFLQRLDKADAAFERHGAVRGSNRLMYLVTLGSIVITCGTTTYYWTTGKKSKAAQREEILEKIPARVSALEERVTKVEEALEERVTKVEEALEERVTKIENVLIVPKEPVKPLSPLHGIARDIMRRATARRPN